MGESETIRSPSSPQRLFSNHRTSQPENGKLPGLPDEMPCNASVVEAKNDSKPSRVLDSNSQSQGSASVPVHSHFEPEALAFAVEDTKTLGLSNPAQDPGEFFEHALIIPKPELGLVKLISSPALSFTQMASLPSHIDGLIFEDSVMDQYINYPLELDSVIDGNWLLPQSDNEVACETSESPTPLASQGLMRMDAGLLADSHVSELPDDPRVLSSDLPRSRVFPVPNRNSRSPEEVEPGVTPHLETDMELDHRQSGLQSRKSFSPSLKSLKRRLSCSTLQMEDIVTALKHFSLSSIGTRVSSNTVSTLDRLDEMSWDAPQELTLESLHLARCSLDVPGRFLEFGGEALTISSSCNQCFAPLNSPFCTTCSWFSQAESFAGDTKKLSCFRVLRLDRFHNTTLHIAAAMGADYSTLTGLIGESGDLNAVNTAGQTFLHVLDPRNLAKHENELPSLLSHISVLGFDFRKVDHQGVNVLQAMLQHRLHQVLVKMIFETLGSHLSRMASRDNLGRTWQSWLLYLAQEAKERDTERSDALNELLWTFSRENSLNFLASLAFDKIPPILSDQDHDELEDLINKALSEPLSEDSYGRNGLHCLAGARLRKSGYGAGYKQLLLARRQIRQSHLSRLLNAGVDVNAYDKGGNQPLLAFLRSSHILAEANEDDREIESYVTMLVKAGANVNSRNRAGESALHVAVGLGIISATRVLLKLGANVHARQREGKSVITLGLEAAQNMRQGMKLRKSLHIRIMTCVNLARKGGAINSPTAFQEWHAPRIAVGKNQQTTIEAARLSHDVIWHEQLNKFIHLKYA